MRTCTNGYGADSTAAVAAYLAGTDRPIVRHLYIIGEPGSSAAIQLTDDESPIVYPPYGTFFPSVLSRGPVTAKIGFEVQKTNLAWTPGSLANGVGAFTPSIATADPIQLARIHYFDNWPVRIFKIWTPTRGDAMTLGGCPWFGGRIGASAVSRMGLNFEINSFLDVVTQKVPANVIESTSSLASYTAASFVDSETSQPTFSSISPSTTTSIYADCVSPTAGKIYSGNKFVGGYMVFLDGPGATLAGYWSAIGANGAYIDGGGVHHSQFAIYSPLPWPPTPGVDKFYVAPAAPINLADGDYFGFPYVPAPSTAV